MLTAARSLAVVVVAIALGCRGGTDSAPPRVTPAPATDAGSDAITRANDDATAAIDDATAAIDAAPPDAPRIGGAAAIVDWPVAWSPERDRLMLGYRRLHSDPAATDLTIEPRLIVLHYTGGHSAKGTHGYFDRTRLEAERAGLRKGGEVNVVSHFIVDRDGTIYRVIPETRMGRHAIGVNHVSIGVENVGDEQRYPLTAAQVAANAALIRDLASRHPIELVIGHHEVRDLVGTPWFVEHVKGYRNAKGDPGARFMTAVRAALGDSPLAQPPPRP